MSSINLASKLPLDCQSFVALRSRGAVYVDKTAFIYQIARQIRPQILTRPPRFGKSTLLSTLEKLFLHGVKPLADQSDSPFKPRLEVMSLNGRADCVFDVPQCHLTVVFEFKYEASFDQNKLDDKLAEALQQIKDRKYALNGNSEPRVARFGLVFCGEPGKRGFARVALADVLPSNG